MNVVLQVFLLQVAPLVEISTPGATVVQPKKAPDPRWMLCEALSPPMPLPKGSSCPSSQILKVSQHVGSRFIGMKSVELAGALGSRNWKDLWDPEVLVVKTLQDSPSRSPRSCDCGSRGNGSCTRGVGFGFLQNVGAALWCCLRTPRCFGWRWKSQGSSKRSVSSSLGSVGPLGGIFVFSASSGPLCGVLMGIVGSVMTEGMGIGGVGGTKESTAEWWR